MAKGIQQLVVILVFSLALLQLLSSVSCAGWEVGREVDKLKLRDIEARKFSPGAPCVAVSQVWWYPGHTRVHRRVKCSFRYSAIDRLHICVFRGNHSKEGGGNWSIEKSPEEGREVDKLELKDVEALQVPPGSGCVAVSEVWWFPGHTRVYKTLNCPGDHPFIRHGCRDEQRLLYIRRKVDKLRLRDIEARKFSPGAPWVAGSQVWGYPGHTRVHRIVNCSSRYSAINRLHICVRNFVNPPRNEPPLHKLSYNTCS